VLLFVSVSYRSIIYISLWLWQIIDLHVLEITMFATTELVIVLSFYQVCSIVKSLSDSLRKRSASFYTEA